MNVAVRFFSRSGRTEKIATAIAEEANAVAQSVSSALTEDVDILFLGCGIYGGISKEVEKFLGNNKKKVGKIVTFSTSGIKESAHEAIRKVAHKYNYIVAKEEFHCPGLFALRYRDRPNQEDIMEAKKFTKKLLKEMH